MQYNQPYDQPTNPNAPYVDGNPAAGIQGSIVPAAGIEFDQREIVEVINTAYIRKYTDFSSAPCAIPGNNDLTQLRKAIEGFIRTTPTPSWYIDTPVVWTVHGAGAKYTDLNAAFEDLSKYIITHNGSVQLLIAAGRWNYGAAGVMLDHPNADRIVVTGANMLSYPVASDFAVTGYSTSARQNDSTNTLNHLRGHFATEIDFSGGGGFVSEGTGMTLANLLIVGDRGRGGTLFVGAGQLTIANVSCCNSGNSGFAVGGGNLSLADGMFCSASGNVIHGIALAGGGGFWHGSQGAGCQVWCTSNDQCGIMAGFHCGANGYATITCNGNVSGLTCAESGQFQSGYNSQFNVNQLGGVGMRQGAFLTYDGSTFYNNGGPGISCWVGSSAECQNCAFGGNAVSAIQAFVSSAVYATGSSGVAGNTTPPVNSQTTEGSYIGY